MTLEAALLDRLFARFDAIDDPSPPSKPVLEALRAAGWRPAASLRHGIHHPRSDLDLARAMRDGDPTAAEQLFTRYCAMLLAYARSTAAPTDAEDFVQTAFVSLLTTAKLDIPDFNVRAYLFTVVRNRAIKYALARTREPALEDATTLPDEQARNQLDALILQRDLDRAAALIEARCTPAEQAVLALTHADRSAAEIAAVLEITEGNVRVIRHRALAKLRAAFAEDPS